MIKSKNTKFEEGKRNWETFLTWSLIQFFIRNWVTALVRLICLEHLIPPCWYISFTSHHLSAWYCINIVRRNSLLVADSLLISPNFDMFWENTDLEKVISLFDEDEVYFWSNQSMYLFYFQSRMEEIKTALDKKDCKVTIME